MEILLVLGFLAALAVLPLILLGLLARFAIEVLVLPFKLIGGLSGLSFGLAGHVLGFAIGIVGLVLGLALGVTGLILTLPFVPILLIALVLWLLLRGRRRSMAQR